MCALSLCTAPLVLARWGPLTARSGLHSSLGHLAAPSKSSLSRSLPQATLARLRSIHCYTFARKNGEEETSRPPQGEEGTSQPPRDSVVSCSTFSVQPPNGNSDKNNNSPPDRNAGKKNGSSSPPFLMPILISLPSAIIGAVIASKLMAKENVELEQKKKSNTQDIQDLSYALEKAKMKKGLMEHYVPVESVNQIDLRRHMPDSTMLIHGPRGVGKTTVMKAVLCGVEGIVHIQPSPLEKESFYNSILTTVGFKAQGKGCDMLVASALTKISERGGTKPTFLVEVNEKCNEKQLMEILIELKKLVADSQLSFAFVVLSSSRAALLLPVTLHELRVDTIQVRDPPPITIMTFFENRLSKLLPDTTEEERKDLIINYTEQIGTRFLDAVNLLSKLQIAKMSKDENLKGVVEEFVLHRKKTYCKPALEFVAMIDKEKRKEVLTGIINDDLPLSKLVEATGIKDEASLIKTLTSLHPHPVYVDVMTSCVGSGNFVSKKEFQKFI